ncbi:MAG TPA: alpha-2-macroglobulin family protein, partial [Cytophagaceae bacterium]
SYAFEIDGPQYFAEADKFSKIQIHSKDSASIKFRAITLFQKLISFHANDKDASALADVDLKRLGFIKDHSVHANKVELYLSALQHLEEKVIHLPISSYVSYEIAVVYEGKGEQYQPLVSDLHRWERKKASEVASAAIKRFPESYGAASCMQLINNIKTKGINANVEKINLPNQPFLIRLEYRNIAKTHWRIVGVNPEEILAQRKRWENKYQVNQEAKFLEYFILKPIIASGQAKLPQEDDFQTHSTQIKLEGLDPGSYMVLMSTEENFQSKQSVLSYAYTKISSIAYIHRNKSDGSTEFSVLDRKSGNPLPGVTAMVFVKTYNGSARQYTSKQVSSSVSNAQGNILLPYQPTLHNDNFYVVFKHKSDILSTEGLEGYNYGGSFNQRYPTSPLTFTNTIFFLDRAIYRPGQTVFYKGLVIARGERDSKVIPKHEGTVVFYDVNRQEIASKKFVTNEFGTFHGSFTAPSSGLTGNMSMTTLDHNGSVSFSVEEYKRPKFEVELGPLVGAYRLGDSLHVPGHAKSYAGANIDHAKVTFRVVRNARFPIWWCFWKGITPDVPQMQVAAGISQTDVNGKFNINFMALPDLAIDSSSAPTFIYTVYADVTDINGETRSSQTELQVGYKALEVSVDMLDIDKNKSEHLQEKYEIKTTNLAGEFEPAIGKISVYKLKTPSKSYRPRVWPQVDQHVLDKTEFEKFFPYDMYLEESNITSWPREQEVLTINFNTAVEKYFVLKGIENWVQGQYVVEVHTRDRFNSNVKDVKYFKVFDSNEKKLAVPALNHFQLLTPEVEPGQSAKLLVGTTDDVQVLYEVEYDHTIIDAQRFHLKDEQRVIEIPIKEAYRGNIAIHYTTVHENRLYVHSASVTVPFTNKRLDISFESFRDKLQSGEAEQWSIKVKGTTADKVAAEMVATLYDASLDAFKAHEWSAKFFEVSNPRLGWLSTNGFEIGSFQTIFVNESNFVGGLDWQKGPSYDQLNFFGYSYQSYNRQKGRYVIAKYNMAPQRKQASSTREVEEELSEIALTDDGSTVGYASVEGKSSSDSKPKNRLPKKAVDFSQVKARSNFNETAFFYPNLYTNEHGEIIIKFTIPEALTRWKMLGFAHTSDLKSGTITKELVTQKSLMIVPNQPRFFRENDKMQFSAKITSLAEKALSGQAQLEFFDALTMKPVNQLLKNKNFKKDFKVKAGESVNLEWDIEIPEGIQALSYRILAKAGNFSDGEEMILPVVTNRMLVTETLPLSVRGNQSKEFKFDKLLTNTSLTFKHHKYTLEFTSNPAWYAIQALPYLMEYPYECVEQTFSRYYANSIAAHVANSNPKIKNVFDTWINLQPDALLSNLAKNQELKSALLEETPWVLQAKDENQRKRAVAMLFDLNRMGHESDKALEKILKAQSGSGGFSWFPNLPEDRYMTQQIVASLGHLQVMGVTSTNDDPKVTEMLRKAVAYLDAQIEDDYRRLKADADKNKTKLTDNHLDYIHIHYLYARSYFKDLPLGTRSKEAFDYYLGQGRKYWHNDNIYTEGMLGLALARYGDKELPKAMIKSFSERALHHEELGMYWKYESGYYWYQAPIETHSLMIEVYDEVANDQAAVEELKIWLLKQKQTQDWRTTKATAEACYALLRRGVNALSSDRLAEITIGGKVVDPSKQEDTKVEAGTGYFKTSWNSSEITADMGNIKVTKDDAGVAWGAVYWQYFEQLDKISTAETPLKIKKQLFLTESTDKGPVLSPLGKSALKIGNLVTVRIEIRVDRNLEYVHLKDMRAAGLEPVNTLSGQKYQDGLYYYESTRDLATHFFMGFLPKGTYVFEYPLRVSQKGNFSNGITTMQCMYAPEFSSHSEGIRIDIK